MDQGINNNTLTSYYNSILEREKHIKLIPTTMYRRVKSKYKLVNWFRMITQTEKRIPVVHKIEINGKYFKNY